MPSRFRDESKCKCVCIFEFTAVELGGTGLYRGLELYSLLIRQFVVLGQQYLHRDSLRQIDRFIRHDLSVMNMSSDRLHMSRIASAPIERANGDKLTQLAYRGITQCITLPVHRRAPFCTINRAKSAGPLARRRFAKVDVEGSNPFSRSTILNG